jgi:hypothetical protein
MQSGNDRASLEGRLVQDTSDIHYDGLEMMKAHRYISRRITCEKTLVMNHSASHVTRDDDSCKISNSTSSSTPVEGLLALP